MLTEDDMYLDSETDQEEDSLDLEDDPSDDDEPPQRQGGNLGTALKKEREESKRLREEREQYRQQLERQSALLEQLGQNRQPQQQQDPDELNRLLQERLFENPSHVLGHYAQQAELNAIRRMAPQQKMVAKSYLSTHPEYSDLYKVPEVQQVLDAFVENQLEIQGSIDYSQLDETAKYLSAMRNAFTGGGGTAKPSSKGREGLTSAVNKSSGLGSKQGLPQTEAELIAFVNKMPPKQFAEWEAKNKDHIRKIMTR